MALRLEPWGIDSLDFPLSARIHDLGNSNPISR